MPIHTREEGREIRHAASQAIILRYSWCECIEYIKTKTGHDLSKTAFFKIKKQLKSEARDWVLRLRDDHDEFLSEFRQLYQEMVAFQRELWDIAMANKQENPMVSVRAIDSLHRITLDLARVIDEAPYLAGGDPSKSSQNLSLPVRDVSEIPV
ncbi:MAG: hypothetical protein WA941_12355 [Nitrososphaeraceae archaeon]